VELFPLVLPSTRLTPWNVSHGVFLVKPLNLGVHAYDATPSRSEPSVPTLHGSSSFRCLMSRELPAEETDI